MSMAVRYIVECDECGRYCQLGTKHTRAEAQNAAEKDGWKRVADGKDLCPSCYDEAQKERKRVQSFAEKGGIATVIEEMKGEDA